MAYHPLPSPLGLAGMAMLWYVQASFPTKKNHMTHMFDETENGTNIQPKHSSLGHKLAFVGGFLSFLGVQAL